MIEGDLTIHIGWNDAHVTDVTVRSSRVNLAAHLTRGKPSAVAADLVPRLYSLCTCAQGAAAAAATAFAEGEVAIPDADLHALRLRFEALREHGWRLAIDLPHALGIDPAVPFVRRIRQACAPVLAAGARPDARVVANALAEMRDAVAAQFHGVSAEAWLAFEPEDLDAWLDAGTVPAATWLGILRARESGVGASAVALMPPATPAALAAHVLPGLRGDAAFTAAPLWSGAPAETGALARMRTHPLLAGLIDREGTTVLARAVARLTELAALLVHGDAGMPDGVPYVQALHDGDGAGVAAVQTARGLLLHRVRVRDGAVEDYAVVAPTEWNFHPLGAAAEAMRAVHAADTHALERRARLIVQALDPCVRCTVEIGHA